MTGSRTAIWALFGLSCLLAIPYLEGRIEALSSANKQFGDRTLDERSALLDNPAYLLSIELSKAVPPQGCVGVLAYAGPNAVEYYSARLDYLLYPRRVHIAADSSTEFRDCGHLAVFQDRSQNLRADPFAGAWDAAALKQRLDSLETITSGPLANVYRIP